MNDSQGKTQRITASKAYNHPPLWAVLERQLIEKMNGAAEPILEKYVNPDGSLMWPTSPDFASIDGLDDAYESFHNWPLFYALGGAEKFKTLSLREWEAITQQFTHYDCGHGHPMVVKEYEQGYDWMHQGEGYYYLYMLALADPTNPVYKARAQRFAGFYLNEDPEVHNFDEHHKVVPCTYIGSMGPGHDYFTGAPWGYADWKQWYGLPFQGVPGCPSLESIKETGPALAMAQAMKKHMAYGDVATNLAITGMMTHAYLFTGDVKYKTWIKEYVEAWMQRAQANGGILPDNVGLSGKVGENMDGKWYGGYYGWTWPHGWPLLGDPVTLAAENALLLTHDRRYLDLPRSQMDVLVRHGIQSDGTLYVPTKYGDPGNYEYNLGGKDVLTADAWEDPTNHYRRILWKDGWFEFQPMRATHVVHLWHMAKTEEDLKRVQTIRNHHSQDYKTIVDTQEKDQGGHDASWASYLCGEYPGYPEDILRYNLFQVERRLSAIKSDTQDPATYGDYYLQVRNPLSCEGLVQLTLGAPLPLYNGGLLMASLRYFDRELLRPGLPQDVAALVEKVEDSRLLVHLVNLSQSHLGQLVIQGGAYGEHQLTGASYRTEVNGVEQSVSQSIDAKSFELDLLPQAEITLEITLQRFTNDPSYQLPWA